MVLRFNGNPDKIILMNAVFTLSMIISFAIGHLLQSIPVMVTSAFLNGASAIFMALYIRRHVR